MPLNQSFEVAVSKEWVFGSKENHEKWALIHLEFPRCFRSKLKASMNVIRMKISHYFPRWVASRCSCLVNGRKDNSLEREMKKFRQAVPTDFFFQIFISVLSVFPQHEKKMFIPNNVRDCLVISMPVAVRPLSDSTRTVKWDSLWFINYMKKVIEIYAQKKGQKTVKKPKSNLNLRHERAS